MFSISTVCVSVLSMNPPEMRNAPEWAVLDIISLCDVKEGAGTLIPPDSC